MTTITVSDILPQACANPCGECPWLRTSTPGHLGPYSPEEWRAMAHSDSPIACHETIREADEQGYGSWASPKIRQCKGAAIYRANVFKSPRDPQIAVGPADKELVFDDRTGTSFIEHHSTGASAEFFAAARDADKEPNAVECLECDSFTDYVLADHGDPCDACGGVDTLAVIVSPCLIGPACEDDAHQYGTGQHVKEWV